MSTLTRIFIVLLVLFSIAFTSMTVSIVAQTTNWQDTALKYQEQAKISETNLRHEIAASAAQLATALDEARSNLELASELEAEVDKARQETAQLQAGQAKADSAKSSAEAMNRGLLAQFQMSHAEVDELRKQRDDLERRAIDRERRNIDLNERVNELTEQVDVLLEQKRHFEQQIHILRVENDKIVGGAVGIRSAMTFEDPAGAALPRVEALTPVATRAIRGQVVDVVGNLITVSVGSADGVKPNMIFVIHRDAQYIGDLKITVVDPNQSAGRLTLSARPPTVGDNICDQASLSASRG